MFLQLLSLLMPAIQRHFEMSTYTTLLWSISLTGSGVLVADFIKQLASDREKGLRSLRFATLYLSLVCVVFVTLAVGASYLVWKLLPVPSAVFEVVMCGHIVIATLSLLAPVSVIRMSSHELQNVSATLNIFQSQ